MSTIQEEQHDDPVSKPRRRKPRVTLLSVLVMITLLVVIATIATQPYWSRIVALRHLERVGGVSYDIQGPEWLKNWTGEFPVLFTVHELVVQHRLGAKDIRSIKKLAEYRTLTARKIEPGELKKIPANPNVSRLIISGEETTDESIHKLPQFSNLKELFLVSTSITGRGLDGLEQFPKLHLVAISHPNLSSGSANDPYPSQRASESLIPTQILQELESVASLRQLILRNVHWNDEAIDALVALQQIESFSTRGRRDDAELMSPAQLERLNELPSLTELGVGIPLTEPYAMALTRITRPAAIALNTFSMDNPTVTPEALRLLSSATNIEFLTLQGIDVSAEHLDALATFESSTRIAFDKEVETDFAEELLSLRLRNPKLQIIISSY